MALYTGVTGKITVDSVDIAHMSNWSVELTKSVVEAISFGSDYKEKVSAIKDWTASFDGSADFDTDSGQKDLLDAYESGEEVSASFYLDTGVFMEGTAVVESLSISHAADGKADISISLSGSGAPTWTIPTGAE